MQRTVTCDGCPAGTFSTTFAASNFYVCDACPIGQSSNPGSSSCVCAPLFLPFNGECACGPGYYFDGSDCLRCDNGLIKSVVGNGACLRCELFVDGSSATKAGKLPTSAESCICGFGQVLVSNRCEDCPLEGAVCDEEGIAIESMALLPGFWRTSNTAPRSSSARTKQSVPTPPT